MKTNAKYALQKPKDAINRKLYYEKDIGERITKVIRSISVLIMKKTVIVIILSQFKDVLMALLVNYVNNVICIVNIGQTIIIHP